MKNICFIGAFEKLDLLLYMAKIIKYLNKSVLIIDATEVQKSRYIVPTINPTKSYVTNYEDIDIAIGFKSYEEIEKYIGMTENQKMNYDYILVNIDDGSIVKNFNNCDTAKNYFVTSLELYSIRKGLEVIKNIDRPIKIKRVIFSNNINQSDNYYLDYLSLGYKTIWEDENIIFPCIVEDMENMIESQKISKIKIKGLSQLYKDSLASILADFIEDTNINNLKKLMKSIEKEG